MLHPHADCECFGLHGKLIFCKHGKGISCAVANGKDQKISRDLLFRLWIRCAFYQDSFQTRTSVSLVSQIDPCHPGMKMKFSAHLDDRISHGADDLDQFVRTYMWFAVIQDLFRRAVLDEKT